MSSRFNIADSGGVDDGFWNRANSAAPETPAPPARTAAAKSDSVDIEEIAAGICVPPVKLPRGTCSIPAENLLRQLGRNPRSAEPWVPVGVLGPLLIMAHCRTESDDFWGVPQALIVPIIVDTTQYDSILKDLYTRIGFKPLADSNPVENMH